jgi:SAM-dependent methyltransferase
MDSLLNLTNKKVGTSHDLRLSIDMQKLILSRKEMTDIGDRLLALTKTSEFETQSITMCYGKCQKLNWFSNGANLKQTEIKSTKTVKEYSYSDRDDYAKSFSLVVRADGTCSITPSDSLKSVKLEYTYGFTLAEHPDWVFRLVATKDITDSGQFLTKLPEYKVRIFPSIESTDHTMKKICSLVDDAYDYVQLSASLINYDSVLAKPTVFDVRDVMKRILRSDLYLDARAYQAELYSCAKFVYRDPIMVEKFKDQSGFKRLSNSVVELSRSMYYKDLEPSIDQYYLTDKIDGKRSFLVIDEYYSGRSTRSSDSDSRPKTGGQDKFLGADIRAISDRLYSISKYAGHGNGRSKKITYILDCEMLETGKSHEFFAFDIIAFNGRSTCGYPFHKRLDMLLKCESLLSKYSLGRVKTYVRLTKTGYAKEICEFYKSSSKSKYEIDGLIFTPAGVDYKTAKTMKKPGDRTRVINTDYYNTVSYKWKPEDKTTIDFYMMKIPSKYWSNWDASGVSLNAKKDLYVLCSGVNAHQFKQLEMRVFDGYLDISNGRFQNSQYFPVQFSPDDHPYVYLYQPTDSTDLDNRVGEFLFNHKSKSFELIRVRTDRDVEIARGEYYGNAMKYSELIWHTINYPLTLDMMCDSSSKIGMYFASSDNDRYFSQRAFNSYVKQTLLSKLPGTRILDMMCGHGQDLSRLVNSGYKDIYMIDQDIDALYELLQRKYTLKIKNSNATASVKIAKMDAGIDSSESISIASQLKGLEAGSLDAITINFGIHYLMGDESKIANLAKFVSHFLKPNGKISITCFNGSDIMSLLGDQDKWVGDADGSVKYEIRKAYKSKELSNTGQQIDVMLPFSGSNFYSEYLVNPDYLVSVFASVGLKLNSSDSFGSKLSGFAKDNAKVSKMLSPLDKQYVSLYHYFIFEKSG